MKKLLEQVKALVAEEYTRASEKFGAANNGNHESYAVILEEYEEAVDESATFQSVLQDYWFCVKKNRDEKKLNTELDAMREIAEHAAAEWVQVAAMCHKAKQKREEQAKSRR